MPTITCHALGDIKNKINFQPEFVNKHGDHTLGSKTLEWTGYVQTWPFKKRWDANKCQQE